MRFLAFDCLQLATPEWNYIQEDCAVKRHIAELLPTTGCCMPGPSTDVEAVEHKWFTN